ncbi:helix-turn-helix domain-containing protein [Roseateles sp.]|uniref:helix-turn-helix domain-containing protein n=1 Tax=Roseateles sp. TaxID=1971397 RepID=UPI0039EAECFD
MKKPESVRAILAANVRTLRLSLGVSQEKLGAMAGLHRTYISQLEREKLNVTLDTLELLAAVFSVRVAELLDERGRSAG